MYGGYGMGFSGGGFGSIFMLFFWGLLLVGLILMIKQSLRPSNRSQMVSALSIAAERYARGEIKKEEFETIKQSLS
jgi:putative membrane protein